MKPTPRWTFRRRDARENLSHLWGLQWGYGGRSALRWTAWLPGGLVVTYTSRRPRR